MSKENEIWKTIPDFEDYQASDLGRIKSLKMGREKIMNIWPNKRDYYVVRISNKFGQRLIKVHQLVAMAFLEHKPDGTQKLVVNHIDFNRYNNRADNLEVVTHRENCNKKHLPSSSKYIGVSWYKNYNKWESTIFINGKNKRLGYFNTEIEASNAYQKALKELL